MYKKEHKENTIFDFNEAYGVQLDENNRWVRKAEIIPWDKIEKKYAKQFPNNIGNVAKPLRMALGALLIQKQYNCSDRDLVEEIRENPYLQYFIGLKRFTNEVPFVPSLLVEFRKRLNEEMMMEINEMVLNECREASNKVSKEDFEDKNDKGDTNQGTLILDATCAPQNIAYPQDANILNEARKLTEKIIEKICREQGKNKPRTYKLVAQKEYTDFSKSKRKTKKKVRKEIKRLLQYLRRNIGIIEGETKKGYRINTKDSEELEIIKKVYKQQKEMYTKKVHSCEERIVSISEPYVRPIVRGKAKAPVEFGAKFDMSIDEKGYARVEKLTFEAYNESEVLSVAIERYKERNGKYPERVLVDQIYRNKSNIKYCNERNIRISGVPLGKQKIDTNGLTKKVTDRDNTDRIEVERAFSLAKRRFGLGKIWTKLEETSKTSIILSIVVMNINQVLRNMLIIFYNLILCNRKLVKIEI